MTSLLEFINNNTEVDPKMIVLEKDVQQSICLTEGILKWKHILVLFVINKYIIVKPMFNRYVLSYIYTYGILVICMKNK